MLILREKPALASDYTRFRSFCKGRIGIPGPNKFAIVIPVASTLNAVFFSNPV